MGKYVGNFYEATLDGETFEKLTDKLIALCGRSVRFDHDTSETDVDTLHDAIAAATLAQEKKDRWDIKYKEMPLLGELEEQDERDERLSYEPQHFWDIY